MVRKDNMQGIMGIVAWIKALSIPIKIATVAGSIAIVGGGAVTTAVVIHQNQTDSNQISVESQSDESQEKADVDEETTKDNDNNDNKEQKSDETTAESENQIESQPQTQSQVQSQIVTQSQSVSQPQTQSAPQQTTQPQAQIPVAYADYNLNENLLLGESSTIGNYNLCWQTIGDFPGWDSPSFTEWDKAFTDQNCSGDFYYLDAVGVGRTNDEAIANSKVSLQKKLDQMVHYYGRAGGAGIIGPLTETLCNKYGLSCGRW